MKKLLIKATAAVALWVACVSTVFWITGCTPEIIDRPELSKETAVETVDNIQVTPQVNDTAQRVTEDTQPDPSDRPWETWTECSQKPGDHPCNFSLTDQNEDTVELYDSHGKVIVVDLSSMWCAVCQNIAPKGDEFVADYGEENVIWITVLIDGLSYGVAPTLADIQAWATTFNIQGPVLAGDRTMIDLTAVTGYPITSWPTLVVIDKEMVLQYGINGWNEATVRGWVESLL